MKAEPLEVEYLYHVGCVARDEGDLVAAESRYREALQRAPTYLDAWIALGILLRQTGRLAEAAECHQQVLLLSPDHPLGLLSLGNVRQELGEHTRAGELFRRVLQVDPNSAEAHNNIAKVLWRSHDMRAIAHWHKALDLQPDCFDAAQALGNCLVRVGMYDDAIRAHEITTRLQPENTMAQLSLGHALLGARRYNAVSDLCERLLRVAPNMHRVRVLLANALVEMGQYAEPLALYREALAAAPDDAWTRAYISPLLLRYGQFEEGWDHYSCRWHLDETRELMERGYSQPKWSGEQLIGRRLLLISEQGLGDEIMFASTFGEVIAETEHCIIECDARLAPIFAYSFPKAYIVGVRKDHSNWFRLLGGYLHSLPPFDLWTAAGDIVANRRRRPDAFPRHANYLWADPDRVAYWRARLAQLGEGRLIGLSWRGGTAITSRSRRSMSLESLVPLLNQSGTHFICLQYDECKEEIATLEASHGVRVHHWPEALADYSETAALVTALDLVISVCTTIVHLAGALGRPVWVMAPQVADWRYGHQGQTMIWHPTVTVYRQIFDGDWSPVIAGVCETLSSKL